MPIQGSTEFIVKKQPAPSTFKVKYLILSLLSYPLDCAILVPY